MRLKDSYKKLSQEKLSIEPLHFFCGEGGGDGEVGVCVSIKAWNFFEVMIGFRDSISIGGLKISGVPLLPDCCYWNSPKYQHIMTNTYSNCMIPNS